ncbi:peptide deformylase [Zavarzinia compransoris]|uniref:peptide deformylase n=1 Tax=Zavarzinia marina TaxID=2911065 RepID=UPI001F18DC14|nr:peptide deformylase [Zavarzinia marina]MCF4165832.1 peptide deformylase [Zavarzinia marina]
MAMRPILIAPDPRLKQKSTPVEVFDADLQCLIDDMFETMYAAPGIGLAAIQVGVAKRLLVIDISREDEEKAPRVFINPEIVWTSEGELSTYEEGCLSVPEQYAEVQRPSRVRVSYRDRDGEAHEEEMEGLLATCIQHEMDHLEGILFVDHLSLARRSMLMRKLAKSRKFARV